MNDLGCPKDTGCYNFHKNNTVPSIRRLPKGKHSGCQQNRNVRHRMTARSLVVGLDSIHNLLFNIPEQNHWTKQTTGKGFLLVPFIGPGECRRIFF